MYKKLNDEEDKRIKKADFKSMSSQEKYLLEAQEKVNLLEKSDPHNKISLFTKDEPKDKKVETLFFNTEEFINKEKNLERNIIQNTHTKINFNYNEPELITYFNKEEENVPEFLKNYHEEYQLRKPIIFENKAFVNEKVKRNIHSFSSLPNQENNLEIEKNYHEEYQLRNPIILENKTYADEKNKRNIFSSSSLPNQENIDVEKRPLFFQDYHEEYQLRNPIIFEKKTYVVEKAQINFELCESPIEENFEQENEYISKKLQATSKEKKPKKLNNSKEDYESYFPTIKNFKNNEILTDTLEEPKENEIEIDSCTEISEPKIINEKKKIIEKNKAINTEHRKSKEKKQKEDKIQNFQNIIEKPRKNFEEKNNFSISNNLKAKPFYKIDEKQETRYKSINPLDLTNSRELIYKELSGRMISSSKSLSSSGKAKILMSYNYPSEPHYLSINDFKNNEESLKLEKQINLEKSVPSDYLKEKQYLNDDFKTTFTSSEKGILSNVFSQKIIKNNTPFYPNIVDKNKMKPLLLIDEALSITEKSNLKRAIKEINHELETYGSVKELEQIVSKYHSFYIAIFIFIDQKLVPFASNVDFKVNNAFFVQLIKENKIKIYENIVQINDYQNLIQVVERIRQEI